MSARKQYLILKEYQLKTAIFIIIVVTSLTAVVILGILSNVMSNNNKIKTVVKEQNNIVDFLDTRIASIDNDKYKITLEKISKNHKKNRSVLERIIFNNNILLISIFIFTVIQGIVLYRLMIKRTHRISGPVNVMTGYIQDIIDGKYPNMRSLRKTDELQEFYQLLKEMIETVKKREEELKNEKTSGNPIKEISLD